MVVTEIASAPAAAGLHSMASSMRWLVETADRWRAHDPRLTIGLDRLLGDRSRLTGVTDSWFERVVARLLQQHDLPPMVLQYQVTVNGRIYRIDIAFPSVKIGVRDLYLGSVGWQLLYVTWWQSQHPEAFVDLVVATIRARQADVAR